MQLHDIGLPRNKSKVGAWSKISCCRGRTWQLHSACRDNNTVSVASVRAVSAVAVVGSVILSQGLNAVIRWEAPKGERRWTLKAELADMIRHAMPARCGEFRKPVSPAVELTKRVCDAHFGILPETQAGRKTEKQVGPVKVQRPRLSSARLTLRRTCAQSAQQTSITRHTNHAHHAPGVGRVTCMAYSRGRD